MRVAEIAASRERRAEEELMCGGRCVRVERGNALAQFGDRVADTACPQQRPHAKK